MLLHSLFKRRRKAGDPAIVAGKGAAQHQLLRHTGRVRAHGLTEGRSVEAVDAGDIAHCTPVNVCDYAGESLVEWNLRVGARRFR